MTTRFFKAVSTLVPGVLGVWARGVNGKSPLALNKMSQKAEFL
jgi:hypothetical protein